MEANNKVSHNYLFIYFTKIIFIRLPSAPFKSDFDSDFFPDDFQNSNLSSRNEDMPFGHAFKECACAVVIKDNFKAKVHEISDSTC